MKVILEVNNKQYSVTLNESKAAKDFLKMLPLTLTLEDYASTEKIADLPNKLDSSDSPSGYKPSVGDVSYYVPWGNLAIFYKDFRHSEGLVNLGVIEEDSQFLLEQGATFDVTFKQVSEK